MLTASDNTIPYSFRLIDRVDEFLSIHIGGTFVCYLVIICSILYILIWGKDDYAGDYLVTFMLFYWLLGGIFYLALILIGGALINSKV